MAAVTPTVTSTNWPYRHVTWALTQADSEGVAVDLTNYRSANVHILGSFDSGTAVLQGSHNGTDFVTLKDRQGATAVSVTAAGYFELIGDWQYVRPAVTGEGASAAITVSLRSWHSRIPT
jgi:hypothetical protein